MEVVASLSQGRTAAAQCGLFTYKSVPVIFEPPCTKRTNVPRHHADMFYSECQQNRPRNVRSTPDIIREIISRKERWAGNMACMEKTQAAFGRRELKDNDRLEDPDID